MTGTSRRVVHLPPEATPDWVRGRDYDLVATLAGLPGDEMVWLSPEGIGATPTFIGGVRVVVAVPSIALRDAFQEDVLGPVADRERIHSHSFQVEGQHVALAPEADARLASFLFHLTYRPAVEFDPGAVDALAHDEAVTAVTSAAHAWLTELWRWAGVVGARRLGPVSMRQYRYLATLYRTTGEAYEAMPYPHRTTLIESRIVLPRKATPMTTQTLSEIVALVADDVPAPAAPLLVIDAVDTALGGDLRTAMVQVGTVLDLVLDDAWGQAQAARGDLPSLSGTLGAKARTFESHGVDLPRDMTREEFQSSLIAVRNRAAHGDSLDDDDVWDALCVTADIVEERWPVGPPSGWPVPPGRSGDVDDTE